MAKKIVHKECLFCCIYLESTTLNNTVKIINKIIEANSMKYMINFYICMNECIDIDYVSSRICRKDVIIEYLRIENDIDCIKERINKDKFVFIDAVYDYETIDVEKEIQDKISIRTLVYDNIHYINLSNKKIDKYVMRSQYFNEKCIVYVESIKKGNYLKNFDNKYINFDGDNMYLTEQPCQKCIIEDNTIMFGDKRVGMPNKNRKMYLYDDKCDYTVFNRINESIYIYNEYLFDKKEFEIVVARYNEDISWLLPYEDCVTIYNKGNDCCLDTIVLPNVGRESHTYLWHIINNYDNLSTKTLFTQGSTNDHNNFPIAKYMSDENFTINLDIRGINAKNGYGHLRHIGKWLKEYQSGDMLKEKFTFKDWWLLYIKKNLPNLQHFFFSQGAIFSIKSHKIKRNTIEYYKKLITCVDNHKHPESCHYFERAWFYIFDKYD